ncbi:MAG: hypothetical protein MUP90_05755, partial [Gammaproteobacteria bacterium]|nr:hypothetical protein [Gammaproteobacteria bacterium]
MGKLVFGIPVRRMSILLAVMAFSISAGLTQAKPPNSAPGRVTKVTQAERQAAADAAAAAGFSITAQALPQGYLAATPGDTPHYFSHPNYANSPLPVAATTPTPAFVGNPLDARAYDTDTAANVFVVLPTVLTAGELISFDTWVQTTSIDKVFQAYVLRPTTNTDEFTVVYASGSLSVPATLDTAATFPVSPFVTVQDGDRLAFYGQGIPLDIGTGIDTVLYPAAPSPVLNDMLSLGTTFPILQQARTYSFGATVQAVTGLAGGIRKFVDGLPGLCDPLTPNSCDGTASLRQAIPLAIPDTTTYPGSDYYEIGVVQYREQMHSDLPGTLLRGYVQLAP